MRGLRRAAPWLLPALLLGLVYVVFVAALRRSDYLVFLRAAEDVVGGRNPYPSLDDPFLYGGSAFVYPWLSAFLFAPFTLVPQAVGEAAFLGLSGVALVAGCRLAGVRHPLAITPLLLAATTIRGLQVGSLNAFLFLGLVLAWRWRNQPGRLATVLVLVVGTKLFLAPLLGWLLLTRRWRSLALSGGGLAVLFGGSFLLGPIGPRTYLKLLDTLTTHEGQQGFSLQRLLAMDLSTRGAELVCVAIGAALLLVGAAVSHRSGDELPLWTGAVLAAIVMTPILWTHYLLLALVPLLLVPIATVAMRTVVLSAGALVSWVVAPPDKVDRLLLITLPDAIRLLHVALLALFLGVCVRAALGPRSPRTLLPPHRALAGVR